jgi:2-deoxy-scyllo-inosamine dehydrogenase (SAM-dependent)
MLKYTQILVLEVGSTCNLDCVHGWCPVSIRKTGPREMDDAKIVSLALEAYELGFEGWIAFHYYNEPLLHPGRLSNIIDQVKAKVPHSKFLLWTNGTYMNAGNKPVIDKFDWVVVSDYFSRGYDYFKKFADVRHLQVNPEVVDGRRAYGDTITSDPCSRPFIEFSITAFGDVHICCQDWKGKLEIGSVFDYSLKELDDKRTEFIKTIVRPMDEQTPEVCRKCAGKISLVAFDEPIANKAYWCIEDIKKGKNDN